jgi:sulfite dehydrogenase (cytochrome) subunit B
MRTVLLLAATLLAAPALAAEQSVELRPGVGVDAVAANCGGCHSLDYVRMNAPFLTADAWKAEVTKMRAAFGAPIGDADAAAIQAYLAGAYGAAK